MTATNKFLIEGLDRLGKDTLIQGIQHKRGYHQVLHYSKPAVLDCYVPLGDTVTNKELSAAQKKYQERSFRTMMAILGTAKYAHIICNRAHLGECVYAPLYRGYSGEYVFDLERQFDLRSAPARLILLTEDFENAKHFVDDGMSFDTSKRAAEQELFLEAFGKSHILDKRVICVTDPATGAYRDKESILEEALMATAEFETRLSL